MLQMDSKRVDHKKVCPDMRSIEVAGVRRKHHIGPFAVENVSQFPYLVRPLPRTSLPRLGVDIVKSRASGRRERNHELVAEHPAGSFEFCGPALPLRQIAAQCDS